MRLGKLLADRGMASRREAERWITEGRVTVNGEVAEVTRSVEASDHIRVDDKPIPRAVRRVYLVLNKPRGFITGRDDPRGRRSVIELLGALPERVEPVGRLDFNTEGALLLTNDGELAHALTHPSRGVPKRYVAKVYREPSAETISRLERGIQLEDGRTAPAKVRVVKGTEAGNSWVEVTVTEGKNRLVRRMLAAVGHPVSKLRRESFATITVRDLPLGTFRGLTTAEVERLREIASGVPPSAAGHKAGGKKAGFAKPDPKWLARRVDGKKRSDKRGRPPRGGAAR